MKRMKGIVAALTTPFTDNDCVDYDAAYDSAKFLIDKGIQFLYPCGTTGEMHLMSVEERKKLAETIVSAAAGKASVFVQCGAMTTRDTCSLIEHAKKIGADGVGIVTPTFFSMSDEELIEYYKAAAVCAGKDFPIYIYNIPQCSANDISADVCRKLAEEYENIIGIKYSWNDAGRISDYVRIKDYSFSVLVGMEGHILPYLSMGCDGVVSGCANAFPELFVAMYRAYSEGNGGQALRLQRRIDDLLKILTPDHSIARVKAAQHMRGKNYGRMRAPLQALDQAAYVEMEKALKDFL